MFPEGKYKLIAHLLRVFQPLGALRGLMAHSHTTKEAVDLQATKSRETWCYAGEHPALKEKRPGFVFAEGSWQVHNRV